MSDNNLLGQDHDVFTFHVASLLQVCCPDILRQRLYNPTRSPSSTETGTEASLALLPPPGTCGVSNGDRIFGGELTALDEHPWLALIGYIRRECPRIPTRWSHILTVLVFEYLPVIFSGLSQPCRLALSCYHPWWEVIIGIVQGGARMPMIRLFNLHLTGRVLQTLVSSARQLCRGGSKPLRCFYEFSRQKGDWGNQ